MMTWFQRICMENQIASRKEFRKLDEGMIYRAIIA